MIYGLDLFSGIGGAAIALRKYIRPVAYCEIDRECQATLLTRMAGGDIPQAPIWDDVCTLRARDIPYPVDVITGGPPCQDISVAGGGLGLAGDRSRLFWEIPRLCRELRDQQERTPIVYMENVPAITLRGGCEVVGAFTSMGYDCRWGIASASSVGAPHKRERFWLLAYPKSERLQRMRTSRKRELLAYDRERILVRDSERRDWWRVEPRVVRMVHGIPKRAHRVRGLGNGWVPESALDSFENLLGILER